MVSPPDLEIRTRRRSHTGGKPRPCERSPGIDRFTSCASKSCPAPTSANKPLQHQIALEILNEVF